MRITAYATPLNRKEPKKRGACQTVIPNCSAFLCGLTPVSSKHASSHAAQLLNSQETLAAMAQRNAPLHERRAWHEAVNSPLTHVSRAGKRNANPFLSPFFVPWFSRFSRFFCIVCRYFLVAFFEGPCCPLPRLHVWIPESWLMGLGHSPPSGMSTMVYSSTDRARDESKNVFFLADFGFPGTCTAPIHVPKFQKHG